MEFSFEMLRTSLTSHSVLHLSYCKYYEDWFRARGNVKALNIKLLSYPLTGLAVHRVTMRCDWIGAIRDGNLPALATGCLRHQGTPFRVGREVHSVPRMTCKNTPCSANGMAGAECSQLAVLRLGPSLRYRLSNRWSSAHNDEDLRGNA
jgi:hypothetical protein